MGKDTFTLYVDSRFASPYAMSAFVALIEKNISFEMKTLHLGTNDLLNDEYKKQSLTNRVPILIHNNFSLSESSAIDEYIEELFPAPHFTALYPANICDRARARQIQAWLRSDLMPIREERPTDVIFYSPSKYPLSEKAKTTSDKLIETATLLIGDKVSLFNEWCIADTDLALMLQRLIKNNDVVPENLVRYANEQWDRPSVKKWLQLNRKV